MEKKKISEESSLPQEKTYHADGIVLGYLWGGGEATYPSRCYNGYKSREELVEHMKLDLKSGQIDGGMGFECLISAMMEIKEVTRIEMDKKPFYNETCDFVYLVREGDTNTDEYHEDACDVMKTRYLGMQRL